MKKILLALVLIPSLASGAGWDETITAPQPDDTIMINDVSQPEGSKTQYTSLQRLPVSDTTSAALEGKVNNSGYEVISGVKNFTDSPAIPEPINASDAATKNYVDNNAGGGGGTWGTITGTLSDQNDLWSALEGKLDATGSKTIDGATTFVLPPTVPTPVSGNDAVTKDYADTKVPLAGDITVDGVKTFSSSPVVPEPTTDLQAATKKYVDDVAGEINNSAYNTLAITADHDVTEQEIRANDTISNFGAIEEAFATLPALDYSLKKVLSTESANSLGSCPPSGESLKVDGVWLAADVCAVSPALEGTLATLMRARQASGDMYYHIVSAVGTWDEGDTGYDTTGITFWWRMEQADFSATNGTLDYVAGTDNDVWVQKTGALFNTTAAYTGVNGLNCPVSAAYADLENVQGASVTDIVTSTEGRVGFWLRTKGTDQARVFRFAGATGDSILISARQTDLNLRWEWSDSSIARSQLITANGTITSNAFNFVEFAWQTDNTGTYSRRIYVDGEMVGEDTSIINSFSSGATVMAFGDVFWSAGADLDIDSVRASKDSTKSLYESREQLNYDNS